MKVDVQLNIKFLFLMHHCMVWKLKYICIRQKQQSLTKSFKKTVIKIQNFKKSIINFKPLSDQLTD